MNFLDKRRYEQLEAAKKAWAESEWRLQFLRTESSTPPPQPTDEEMKEWTPLPTLTPQIWN